MRKSSRQFSILTNFLGEGGGNAIHFMDKCFSGHLGVSVPVGFQQFGEPLRDRGVGIPLASRHPRITF